MQRLQAPWRATVAAALCAALALSALVVLDASRRAAVARRHRSTALLSTGSIRGVGKPRRGLQRQGEGEGGGGKREEEREGEKEGEGVAMRRMLRPLQSAVLALQQPPANSMQEVTTDARRAAGRRTQLWDLEEGGPTDADQGFNYNPVVLDDAVSRRGYPALVTGWREWGCDGDRESLETEWACVNHPDNHGADYDDDYTFDSYGRGGRFTGHFTEDLDI